MNQAKFCRLTGLTRRQADYWVRAGIELAEPQQFHGSGTWRNYKLDAVEKARLLLAISNSFGRYFSLDTLREIFDNYELGYLALGDGIFLNWRVHDRFNAPPGGSATVS